MAKKGGERKEKRKLPSKRWKKYEVDESGNVKRKGKFCPKCGAGVFLAQHKDRVSCGKCGYTEFLKKDR